AQDNMVAQDGYDNVCSVGPTFLQRDNVCVNRVPFHVAVIPGVAFRVMRHNAMIELSDSLAVWENGSLNYERDGILTLRITGMPDCWRACHTLHSRIHCFEDKLMDLEPHDPYAKTVKRVAVVAEEQTKTEKKENLNNRRQCISIRDVAGPSSYSSQPGSKRSNIRKRLTSLTDVVEDHSTLRKDRDWPGLDYQRPFQYCTLFVMVVCVIFFYLGLLTFLSGVILEFRDIEGYWDLRQQTPVHTQQLPKRCYALSVKHPLMVVGTTDRNLIAFNSIRIIIIHHRIRRDKKLTWDELLPQSEADKIGMICLNS
ncbi:RAE1-like protein, partial [Tanacetum coccineum]